MECVIDQIVLNVEDDETMIAFYSQMLMFPPERSEEYRAGEVPFPSVRLNADMIINLFPKQMWQKSTRPGQVRENVNHFCLTLSQETWEHLVERLQAHNIEIEEGSVPRWGHTEMEHRYIFETQKATLSRRDIMKATRVQSDVFLGHRLHKLMS